MDGMEAPRVRWGTAASRTASQRVHMLLGAPGVLAMVISPLVVWGVVSTEGEAPQSTASVVLRLLGASLVVLVLVAVTWRAARHWRRGYWIVPEVLGLQLWRGRDYRPFWIIPAGAVQDVGETQDRTGARVLLLRLQPGLSAQPTPDDLAIAGRSVLLDGSLADTGWDLGFVLDPRDGDPAPLAAVARRLVAPAV